MTRGRGGHEYAALEALWVCQTRGVRVRVSRVSLWSGVRMPARAGVFLCEASSGACVDFSPVVLSVPSGQGTRVSVELLEVPPMTEWGWGVVKPPPKSSWRGCLQRQEPVLCFPSPPGDLAAEVNPGRVPGPAWEEGLPRAGRRPGALCAPTLPLHGIHLPRGRPALPGHL